MKSRFVIAFSCICLLSVAACHSAGSGSNYDSTSTQADTMSSQPVNPDSTHAAMDSASSKMDTTKIPK